MKITINVNQQLNEVGDEFLDERDFPLTMELDASDVYVIATIDGMPDCYIKKEDLRSVLRLLEENK